MMKHVRETHVNENRYGYEVYEGNKHAKKMANTLLT